MATTFLHSPPGIIATSTHRPYRLTVTGRYLLAGMLAVKPAPANGGRLGSPGADRASDDGVDMAYAARIPATCNAQALPDCHAGLVLMRCLLVDDNAALLSSARALLDQQGVTIVGTASTSAEALQLAAALRPDVVLVDIALGDESGFDLACRLAESNGAAMAVIMISTAAESDYSDLVAESPAAGFLPKAELSAAGIRRILAR